jgi:hypothetical protein
MGDRRSAKGTIAPWTWKGIAGMRHAENCPLGETKGGRDGD